MNGFKIIESTWVLAFGFSGSPVVIFQFPDSFLLTHTNDLTQTTRPCALDERYSPFNFLRLQCGFSIKKRKPTLGARLSSPL